MGGWLDALFVVVAYCALALVPVAILVAILRYAISMKLGLSEEHRQHRRVMAVLAFLRAQR